MDPKQSASATLFQRVSHDIESQLSFGAASLCLVIGLVGLAINTWFSFSTSLDAMLVVSVFYGLICMVRVGQLRKEIDSARSTSNTVTIGAEGPEKIKSAA